jgi:hypothetical protein
MPEAHGSIARNPFTTIAIRLQGRVSALPERRAPRFHRPFDPSVDATDAHNPNEVRPVVNND